MKTNINIFDFDETLFRVPSFSCSEAGKLKPYEWFDDPRSLKEPSRIIPIVNIVERTWNGSGNDVNYLITHRVNECKDIVNTLVDGVGCQFEERFFLGRKENKAMKVLEIIDKNPQATSLTIYEDSLFEIIEYAAVLEDERTNLKIKFVFVDKSKIITLPLKAAVALCDHENIERLRVL